MNRGGLFLVALTWLTGAAGTATAAEAVVWKTQGVSKTEITLGVHTDLSGPAATFGVGTTNSFRLRVEEVNAAGGIHGRKIRLVIEDAQYQVPKAVQAANKLINSDHVFAMVGALGTPMNEAVFKEQFAAGVPNLFPISAARQMYQPFHPLKFSGFAPYYHQMRAGVKWMVERKGKQRVCAMMQATDFGQDVLDGVKDQLVAMRLPLVELTTHNPTDTDYTAALSKLKAANCDLITMGTIVRDAINPYAAARKMGWDVDFLGSTANYNLAVSGAKGGVTEGLYAMGTINAPYRDTASPHVVAWMDRYKARFDTDPTIAAGLGYVVMDFVVFALDKAGPNLTTENLVRALEGIHGYRDIFGGAPQSFGPDRHLGSSEATLYQVQRGRWVPITDSLGF